MTETNPITTAADESNETVTHVGRVAAQMHDASGVHVSRMRGTAIAVVLVLLVAGWGMGLGSVANVHIASMVLMFAALAQGWNVLGGYAGYINFGTVMFFGLGAYTTAITAAAWHLNPLVTAPLAGLASALFAVVIGIPTLRLRGGYFAIATFVLAIAVQSLALVLGITHGSQGLFISPLGMTIGASTRLFFLLFLGLAVLGTLMCWFVEHSRWHSALVAIREDEDAAEVLGVPTVRLKSMALIVSMRRNCSTSSRRVPSTLICRLPSSSPPLLEVLGHGTDRLSAPLSPSYLRRSCWCTCRAYTTSSLMVRCSLLSSSPHRVGWQVFFADLTGGASVCNHSPVGIFYRR
jgi:hypothetical protein